jgi:glycosyltransferase involved in cell wall biosynthesis
MNSYHVLVVTNLWPTEGDPGYGSFVQAQMESLRPLGVEFDVLFINGRESLRNYLRGVTRMRRMIHQQPFDLIHAHFGLAGWVARGQLRVPLVVSFMGDDVFGRYKRNGRKSLISPLFKLSSYLLARLVSAVIVKTKLMKTTLGLSSAHVIPNGVDLELFRPMDRDEARRALGLEASRKFVLFPFDRANQNKRYDLVERAVRRAKGEIPELEILTVSGASRVRMPLYMNAADVLVLASHSEGSPNAVKEAMAVNLPVVAVDVGDASDLIGDIDGCYLVPRDAEAIATRIVEVCSRGTRTRGREWIARLSMEHVAKQIVGVYAEAVRRDEKSMPAER